MQVTVQLQQTSPRSVAYDHGYLLGSAIYEALRAFHAEAARDLHHSPRRAAYAVGEIYHLAARRGEASFRLASPDEQLLRLIGGALMATGKINLGPAAYAVKSVTAAPVPADAPSPAGVHTLSPILIRDPGSKLSLVHDNCEYGNILASVINHDIKKTTGREGSVSILNMEKLAVRKRTLAGRTVMAQKGTFWLDGDPLDIAHVFDYGVGHSNALGFGLVVPEG